ncbi:unnamed protein product [Arabidopsis thaliana]|uniref:Uncharacterized protein n=1 Tax=Arabidopsis thaliana TaxID=3702 RepID=A0A5S9WRJ3_ARATH|nr:unnamed protein product [Arabidopsis thaliana]
MNAIVVDEVGRRVFRDKLISIVELVSVDGSLKRTYYFRIYREPYKATSASRNFCPSFVKRATACFA